MNKNVTNINKLSSSIANAVSSAEKMAGTSINSAHIVINGGRQYSKTFKGNNKDWSLLNLYLFLENPKEWAPGTKMAYRGIKNQEKLIRKLNEYIIKNDIIYIKGSRSMKMENIVRGIS